MKKQLYTADEAEAICRVFCAIERQIAQSQREGKDEHYCAMARMMGGLYVKVFQLPYTADSLGVGI